MYILNSIIDKGKRLNFKLSALLRAQLNNCLKSLPMLFFVLFSFFLQMSSAYAYQKSNVNDLQKVKAAFILNLARFVEWPQEVEGKENNDIILCFYQYNFLNNSVDTIRNKKINNKPIRIKIVRELNVNERCEVVLIPASAIAMFVKYNDFDDLHNIITITDLSNEDSQSQVKVSGQNDSRLLENKIIFRLKREQSRLRFEVNKTASERLGINVGSELLKLGILVKD